MRRPRRFDPQPLTNWDSGITSRLGDVGAFRTFATEFTRSNFSRLAGRTIFEQISHWNGSFADWRNAWACSGVANRKFDQITQLDAVEKRRKTDRDQAERSLEAVLKVEDLPHSKRSQLDEALARPSASKLESRLYVLAEYAFEAWATAAGLAYTDLNSTDRFNKSDYLVAGKSVDVKTTIGIGLRQDPLYYSRRSDPYEVLVGVKSYVRSEDVLESTHYIHGVYDPTSFGPLLPELKCPRSDRRLLNPCFFQPCEVYFDVARRSCDPIQLDPDVLDYCLDHRLFISSVFDLSGSGFTAAFNRLFPTCPDDLRRAVSCLRERELHHLLPLYLADHLFVAIVNGKLIERSAVESVLFGVFQPYRDQAEYLGHLLDCTDALSKVHCKWHEDETLDDLRHGIEFSFGGVKPIVTMRCPQSPYLKTTLLAYSPVTFETLVYGRPDNPTCDHPACGCLLHRNFGPYRQGWIGKAGCPKYGTLSIERSSSWNR